MNVAIRGGHIAVRVLGREDAPPLLLCRPLGGSMVSWAGFADRLALHARVIAFDARGTGQSSALTWSTTTRSMARDAALVLDGLGIARAHVYGISLGGMVASWLAIDSPERVDRLILASTTPRGLTFHTSASRRLRALSRCLGMKDPQEMEACMATRILSTAFRRAHPAEVERIRELARLHPATRRSIGVLLGAAARHDVGRRLRAIAAPTLVLAGGDDELISLTPQRKLAARIPGGKLVVIDAGHDLSAEAPELVATLVHEHLFRTTPSRRR